MQTIKTLVSSVTATSYARFQAMSERVKTVTLAQSDQQLAWFK